ncbi:MAG: ribosomal protein large subunit ribosomal protein [Candidatus Parcubacteria bacterium]
MAKTKQQKQDIITKLEQAFKTAASSVFVSFTGVTVADESAMRKELRDAGVKYFVAKKTLIDRALKATGHEPQEMKGEIAVVYNAAEGGDASAPARMIHAFGLKLKDKLAIAGGIFEGVLRDAASMTEIATIPSMDVLRGRFANVINSPIQRFAIVLSEVAKTKN